MLLCTDILQRQDVKDKLAPKSSLIGRKQIKGTVHSFHLYISKLTKHFHLYLQSKILFLYTRNERQNDYQKAIVHLCAFRLV